jgi:DNA topoisomerase-1
VAWCKENGVEISTIFPKALMEKFPWALEVDKDWIF